jgi:hypothetical protein
MRAQQPVDIFVLGQNTVVVGDKFLDNYNILLVDVAVFKIKKLNVMLALVPD